MANTLALDGKGCNCDINDHVLPMGDDEKENEDDDEGNEREWDAHTEEYKDAWLSMFESESVAGCNSTDGEILIEEWVRKNHDKLCCVHRHRNIDRVSY